MTPMQMLQKWAQDLAAVGHDGDAVVTLPPRLFAEAVEEVTCLAGKYAAYLPPELKITELGTPTTPAFFRFAGPCGYVIVKPETALPERR